MWIGLPLTNFRQVFVRVRENISALRSRRRSTFLANTIEGIISSAIWQIHYYEDGMVTSIALTRVTFQIVGGGHVRDANTNNDNRKTKEPILLLSFWHNNEYKEKRRKQRKNTLLQLCTVAYIAPRMRMKLKLLTWQATIFGSAHGKWKTLPSRLARTKLSPLLCTLNTKYSKSFSTLLSSRILVFISPGSFRLCAFRWIIYIFKIRTDCWASCYHLRYVRCFSTERRPSNNNNSSGSGHAPYLYALARGSSSSTS